MKKSVTTLSHFTRAWDEMVNFLESIRFSNVFRDYKNVTLARYAAYWDSDDDHQKDCQEVFLQLIVDIKSCKIFSKKITEHY